MTRLHDRTRLTLALAVLAGGVLLLLLASGQTLGSTQLHAKKVRYGQGQALNIAAVTLQSRPTPSCPATDNGVCQSRPGVAGPGGSPPTEELLVDPEGALFANVVLPAGAKIIRVEMTGSNSDRATLADPLAQLLALGPGTGSRLVGGVAIFSRTGQITRAYNTALNQGRSVVRADTAYYIRVQVPRTSPGTTIALKSLRIIYRPRVS